MIPPRLCKRDFSHLVRACVAAVTLLHSSVNASATGFYGPGNYLENGGESVGASPEFYWELELKRLARDFHPPEKLRLVALSGGYEIYNPLANTKVNATIQVDLEDFTEALKTGALRPADPAQATAQHAAARDFIAKMDEKTVDPLPAEMDSEFADYHRGAWAWRRGKEHWPEARAAWEKLLQRPVAERHFRTIWATFMLGKLALKMEDPAAVTWFQQTRELAKSGFADSLGMAADSYGWEGRSEWKQGHPGKAAPLFLTQLALGDESAIVSLKVLIPDRQPVEGMLNYGPEEEEKQAWSEARKVEEAAKTAVGLAACVNDPLLRKLVTAHLLATSTTPGYFYEMNRKVASARCEHWLEAIHKAKIEKVEDAEYLGWAAYTAGHYDEAARWLEVAKVDSAATCWLRAKLLWRDGKLDAAAASMAEALKGVRSGETYPNPSPAVADPEDRTFWFSSEQYGGWSFPTAASGDMGSFQLQRGDFPQALDIFLQGGLWGDAAYVAERVLSVSELQAFVDKQPDAANGRLRNLLGRRLVREDHYAEAGKYLKPPYDEVLKKYASALERGADARLPRVERARGWFTAAWLARSFGMEIMGTEVAPDGFSSGGAFEETDLAKQRLLGSFERTDYSVDPPATGKVRIEIKASQKEKKRLSENLIHPDKRYHYRYIAAALAMKAAALLPDQSEELADVVNTAGNWVKDREPKLGDRYFQTLDRRASATKIGALAAAKHWFVNENGPWNREQAAAEDTLRAELKIVPEE